MNGSTYLLVHGAWGGAWCWRDLGAEFSRRGVTWSAVDLPSSRFDADPATNLADDAALVAQRAEALGPVVLIGHSYAGAVITEAAPRIVGLQRLVYVAALVPLLGQSASQTSRGAKARTLLDDAIERDDGILRLRPDLAGAALYGDCAPDVVEWALSQLSTQTLASFRGVRTAGPAEVPSFYVRCSRDRAIDPGLQVEMAARCNDSVTLDSDHSPFISQPLTLADAILS
jgi:pimeloyl-ACP methyl ester carboxylesterase